MSREKRVRMKYFSQDYFDQLKDVVLQYTFHNYDYCYLRAMHEKNAREGTETIIADISYSFSIL